MTKLYQFEVSAIYYYLISLGFKSKFYDDEVEHPYPFDKEVMITFNAMECKMYLDTDEGWTIDKDLIFQKGWIDIYSKEHVDCILESILPMKYRIANN